MPIRRISALCLLFSALLACHEAPRRTVAKKTIVRQSDVQTIDNIDPRPAVISPPPMLQDEAPPPKPLGQPWETPQPVQLTPEDERLRASLPFAPAIALDPVDGSKISITAHTPTAEYKGRVYYFSSDANKRTFTAAPDQYVKGAFSHL